VDSFWVFVSWYTEYSRIVPLFRALLSDGHWDLGTGCGGRNFVCFQLAAAELCLVTEDQSPFLRGDLPKCPYGGAFQEQVSCVILSSSTLTLYALTQRAESETPEPIAHLLLGLG